MERYGKQQMINDKRSDNATEITTLPEPYCTYASILGFDNLYKFAGRYGGRNVYIPTTQSLDLYIRMQNIKTEYNGKNSKELAEKYGVARSTIYRNI